MQLLTFFVTSIPFILVLFYFTLYCPWQLRWEATDDEVKHSMSGDSIVQKIG